MLTRLQKKTLIPSQIIGYALTLCVGVSIVLLAFQVHSDVTPLLTSQTDVFSHHAVPVSKNISLVNTLNKSSIYFDEEELQELREQDFIKEVATFQSASFSTRAVFAGGKIGNLSTDMFFESIPTKYLDVETDQWDWDSTSNFLPIIIPEDFLNLYNFCFAESQSLPVVPQSAIEQVSFKMEIEGNGKKREYESRIVGFSSKINTILVPEKFLSWANRVYGDGRENKSSRLLVEFENANDERIPAFFKDRGYNIDESELESSKVVFFFRLAMVFIITIAIIIIVLSMAFIIMSLNLIIQRNRNLFINLYNIGYSPVRIAKFYQIVVSIVTVVDILVATLVIMKVRSMYQTRLASVFENVDTPTNFWLVASVLLVVLLIVYNITILQNIKKVVTPKKMS